MDLDIAVYHFGLRVWMYLKTRTVSRDENVVRRDR